MDEQAEQIAEWLERATGTPVRVERVAPGDEQVLPEREQRELDALPSRLAEGVTRGRLDVDEISSTGSS